METLISHPVEEIERIAGSWNQVTVEPHRFGGREFKFYETEIGHIHFNGMLDIPFSRAIRDVLLKMDLVKQHHYLPETGWISYRVKNNPSSVNRGAKLLRLSYLFRARRKGDNSLDLKAELDQLNFGEEINVLFR
ncbi:MAG TPA: DUF5519 family protein [Chitinophagales bacterium]|nr:DUF5519 family protein [Chitinophagales bacterium]